MAADIKIELEAFDAEVTNLESARDKIYECKESVVEALEDLSAVWAGTGASAYVEAMNSIKAGFIEYSRGLDQMIINLIQAREAVVEADSAGAQ